MSRYDLPDAIILTLEEARVVYLALDEAAGRANEGSELRIRLEDCRQIIGHKVFPELGGLT